MEALKPCPFCGGKAEIILKNQGYTGNPVTIMNEYVAGCNACKIYTPRFDSNVWMDNYGGVHVDKLGAEEAARAWNRRASDGEEAQGAAE